jgi:hypothetical protein
MIPAAELADRRPLHGDPGRLLAAAAVLRAADAEQIFGTRFPGEYVMTSVALLLEAVASKIRDHGDLGHEVVSAATDIAEHALDYIPRMRRFDPREGRGSVER